MTALPDHDEDDPGYTLCDDYPFCEHSTYEECGS